MASACPLTTRPKQSAAQSRRCGCRVCCQQWWTLKAQSRRRHWMLWKKCCSVKSNRTLPAITWIQIRGLHGTCLGCCPMNAETWGEICSFGITELKENLHHTLVVTTWNPKNKNETSCSYFNLSRPGIHMLGHHILGRVTMIIVCSA